MPSSCIVCKGNTSRPENFLLSCTICNSFWHHRCHKPHIKDHVLVNIVNKFNQDRKTNPAARFAWTCDPCLKKSRSVSNAPILIDDDDDDDDIVILDGPPQKNSRPNAQNNPEAVHRSTIPTTKTQLSTPHIPEIQVRQAIPSSTSKSGPTQFVGHPQSTIKPVVTNKASVHQPPINPLSTKSTRPLGQGNGSKYTPTTETGIRIIDDPFPAIPDPPIPIRPGLIQKSSSSALVSGLVHLSMDDQEMACLENNLDDDDDPLEYVTPPPVATPLLPRSDHPGVGGTPTPPGAETVIQTQNISKVAQEVGLLPSWINARHSAEPDFWQRAFTARCQTQSANSSTAAVPGPKIRKKVKAKPLNAANVERSFSFFADTWMKQTRVGLGF